MTLLIPVGEETLTCVSDCDDIDSGCLARSPDDMVKHDFSDDSDNPKLDIKTSLERRNDDEITVDKSRDETPCSNDEHRHQSKYLQKVDIDEQTSCDKVSASSQMVICDCNVSAESLTEHPVVNNDGEKCNDDDEDVPISSASIHIDVIQQRKLTSSIQGYSDLRDYQYSGTNVNAENNSVPKTNALQINSHINNFSSLQNVIVKPNINHEENKKLRLRKLLQRRSVSESSTSDLDTLNQKKTRERLRHSFSSYENCDTYNEIFENGLEKSQRNVIEDERLNNSINKFLSEDSSKRLDSSNANEASFEKVSRKSFEISDALVNNVKKSMIEEYKKLKKRSSLANQNINDHSPNNYSNSLNDCNTNTINEHSDYALISVGETADRSKMNRTEMKDQTWSSSESGSNITPVSEIRVRTVSAREPSDRDCVSAANETDFRRSKSFPLSDPSYENNSKLSTVSSPPSRLELWKNILAEKRNSIRNHIKGFSKNTENITKINGSNDGEINSNAESDLNDNRVKEDNYKLTVNDGEKCFQQSGFITNLNHNRNEKVNNDSEDYSSLDKNDNGEYLVQNYASGNGVVSCVSSRGILSFAGEVDVPNKSHGKNKIEEACQGIAEALDEIPQTRTAVMESSRITNRNPTTSLTSEGSAKHNETNTEFVMCKDVKYANSNIASIITTIPPPIYIELASNEKGQQCPTPPVKDSDDETEEVRKANSDLSHSSENESDYCQTDDCGDDCDYCSGDEAEDEEEDTCDICRRNCSLSSVCKHSGVMTNGSLRPMRKQLFYDDSGIQRLSASRCLALQAAFRRRHINHQELSAIREYSITSDEQQDSEEEMSHDDSMCDISSSWRFGLCEDHSPSTVESSGSFSQGRSFHPAVESRQIAKLKSNSLPASTPRNQTGIELPKRPGSVVLKQTFLSEDDVGPCIAAVSGVRLPPKPPRSKRARHVLLSTSPPTISTSSSLAQPSNLRPTMGLQGLQQRPSLSKLTHCPNILTGPKTLVPRSPINPNPPYGFPSPPSPPITSPGSPFQGRKSPLETSVAAPPSPRTNSRSGALVTRNFSISDDEGSQRLSRRQVTITRHESAYKEAADKGYLLPPSSPIDPYWLTWKLGVLLKTVEEVGSRLEESEKIVGAWGPFPQDQNLADQHVHNIRKFRETLPDLQRGIDDVNDQAARFSAHNVPLTPPNSAALHDLNNRWKNLETNVNDRWRQIAGRSREVTPLTPAQLASSVSPPWERATATNKVPYYINHAQETTHWDHPDMMDLLDSLSEFNHIKFSAYRTATKLRSLQKKLALDRAKLQMVTDVFDEHGLRGQNDRLIDVSDMIVVLSTLYGRISSDNNDVNTTLTTDLCLNWLLNVYDSQRTGQMRVLSFRVGLICLCRGHLEEKYRYMFRLIADPNRLVDQRKLGLLLHDCVQVPRQLGEVAAFGGSNIEPSVRSCFTKAGKDRETIEAVHFLTWVQQEPQSLVWLAVLHRVAASESVQHQVKCNICKTSPIVGLRYRCLKCLSFDMCQRCFFEGRSTKSHKITHPMHEYCTETRAGDEMKDFTKALKNKFKSKRSLQKHTKKGYLPVQTVLEGDPIESPSPSPSHNVSSQDMHSRLELYASRLAEVELRTNSNSTPDSEDEHGLIAQYCQSLSSTDAPFPVPKSPLQIMASVDADQKDELEQMIRDLEEENRALQAEYERLKSEQPTTTASEDALGQRSEAEMLAEAKLLREHKGRLEARMNILEDHNRQLEAQLQRLRQLLVEQQSGVGSPNKSGTLQTKSVTASQLAMDSPAKINGHSSQGGIGGAYDGLDQMSEYVRPPPPPVGSIPHMGNLYSRAAPYRGSVWRAGESGNWQTGGLNEPREGERLA